MSNKDMPADFVSRKHVYKAVRNYIANELGIGRDEIMQMIKDGAENAAVKMCGQVNLHGIAREQMGRQIHGLRSEIANGLIRSFDVTLRPEAALAELEGRNG